MSHALHVCSFVPLATSALLRRDKPSLLPGDFDPDDTAVGSQACDLLTFFLLVLAALVLEPKQVIKGAGTIIL